MYTVIAYIIVFVFLLINTITDLKRRKIWLPLSAALIVLGIIFHSMVPGLHPAASLTGLLPGLLLLGIAAVNGQAIGKGDALSICACGSMLGLKLTFRITLLSLFLAAAWALLLLLRKKADRQTKIAFMPFLLCAYVFMLFF